MTLPPTPKKKRKKKKENNKKETSTVVRGCVKVEVAVLGSPSLTVLTVSVKVKQH